MHKLIIGATMVALAGCSNSEAQGRAEFIAAGIDAIAPKSIGEGLTITAARAEQATLVLSIDGVDDAEMALPDFQSQMRTQVCSDEGFRKPIEQGVDISLDLTADSGSKSSVEVTSC